MQLRQQRARLALPKTGMGVRTWSPNTAGRQDVQGHPQLHMNGRGDWVGGYRSLSRAPNKPELKAEEINRTASIC